MSFKLMCVCFVSFSFSCAVPLASCALLLWSQCRALVGSCCVYVKGVLDANWWTGLEPVHAATERVRLLKHIWFTRAVGHPGHESSGCSRTTRSPFGCGTALLRGNAININLYSEALSLVRFLLIYSFIWTFNRKYSRSNLLVHSFLIAHF